MSGHIQTPNLIFLSLKTSGIYLRTESIDSDQQPWAPYIAFLQCTPDGRVVNHFSSFIQPEGRMVKQSMQMQHGIDHKAAARLGIQESRALGILSDLLKIGPFETHQHVVTFSDMDPMVISSLFCRFAVSMRKPANAYDKLWFSRPLVEFIDLQKPFAQQICKIPSGIDGVEDYKWPSFEEAALSVLDRDISGSRDSLNDLLVMKEMFFEMKKRGMFPLIKDPA